MLLCPLFSAAIFALRTAAAPAAAPTGPTVKLDAGTFVGASSGPLVTKFLNIPFAKPPVGNLRLRLPVANDPYRGTYDATEYGPACPQQTAKQPQTNATPPIPESEDCLTINVFKPKTATRHSKLPVMAWIYGGGFEFGTASGYDGTALVEDSVTSGQPVIFVAMNYRVNAFGFLPGAEVRRAGVGNIGLWDQRLALRWINKRIEAFGGDPEKVTIWGESAGSVSVSLQMLTNGGRTEGLFRAGIMQSGFPGAQGSIDNGQVYYDQLVQDTGCSSARNTLNCLRHVPFDKFKAAVQNSPYIGEYESLKLPWLPRADGIFLREDAQYLVKDGSVAHVPFIAGDCDDEGTAFALPQLNITTDEQALEFFREAYLPQATDAEVAKVGRLYPQDPTQGSPFDTGLANAITPQFKRLAALQGDLAFQAPRRLFQSERSGKQNMWTYIFRRFKAVPVYGSYHGSDVNGTVIGPGMDLRFKFINFAYHLNPNNGTDSVHWPKWKSSTRKALALYDGVTPEVVTTDTWREAAINYLIKLYLKYPQ